jgi:NADH-quinone oxidoreductase subunit J
MFDALLAVGKEVFGDPVFAAAAGVASGAALLMVTRRNPVYGALWLMQCFLAIAILFLRLQAPFLAAVHVLVYTGAILVLFLFVIMLLNLQANELGAEHSRLGKWLAGAVCGGLFVLLGASFLQASPDGAPLKSLDAAAAPAGGWGGVSHVGTELFARFVVPFEVVSILIIVAILGAVVLAKRKL